MCRKRARRAGAAARRRRRPPAAKAVRRTAALRAKACGLQGPAEEVAGPFWQVCGEGGAQPQPPGGRLTAAEGRQDRPGGAIGLRPGFRPAQTLHGEPQNARTVLLLQKCDLPFNFRGIFPLHCLKQPRKRKKEFSFLRFCCKTLDFISVIRYDKGEYFTERGVKYDAGSASADQ